MCFVSMYICRPEERPLDPIDSFEPLGGCGCVGVGVCVEEAFPCLVFEGEH